MQNLIRRPWNWRQTLEGSCRVFIFTLLIAAGSSQASEVGDKTVQSRYNRGVLLNADIARRINALHLAAGPWAKTEYERLNARDLTARNKIINDLMKTPEGKVFAQALAAGVSPDTVRLLRNPQLKRGFLGQNNYSDMRSFVDEKFSPDPRRHPFETFEFSVLYQPNWLTTTWHPILKPPGLSALLNPEISFTHSVHGGTSLYRLDSIYYDYLAKYAAVSAPDLIEKFTTEPAERGLLSKSPSPLRMQMENGVIYATYVLPVSFLLSDVFEAQTLRKHSQDLLAANGQSDLLNFATALWADEGSNKIRDTIIAHPLEVFTVLLHKAFIEQNLALPEGLLASAKSAEATLRAGDSGAPHVVQNLFYPLLKALSAPNVRAYYPLPWYPDGFNSRASERSENQSNRLIGIAWLKGYNNLIAELGGYLQANQRAEGTFSSRLQNIMHLAGKNSCEGLFTPDRAH